MKRIDALSAVQERIPDPLGRILILFLVMAERGEVWRLRRDAVQGCMSSLCLTVTRGDMPEDGRAITVSHPIRGIDGGVPPAMKITALIAFQIHHKTC